MKSILSILLVLVMLFSFVACSGDDADQPEDTKPTNHTTSSQPQSDIVHEKDELPDDLNFDGETVRFLLHAATENSELFTEELNSDIVNDSLYNRERYVEERLGIELEPAYISENDFETELERPHMSDEDMYQMSGYITFAFTRFVFNDYVHDLYSLEYIDLEKSWWSQTFNAEAKIMDRQYVTMGSLALSLTRSMFAVFYNKSLAESHSSAHPELSELYDIVDRGDWTYDKFYEIGSSIYKDNNGDDLRDREDSFGIGFQGWLGIDVIWSSFDINILSSDGEGWFELDVPTEKLYDAMGKINTLLNDTPGCFNPGKNDSDLNVLSAMMVGDNLLFMSNYLDAVESATLRNMQSDYGILPFPKHNAEQDKYYTYAHDSYTSFAIPKTNRNPDTAAAVLEALTSYSYRDTEPAYLDTALKGKYMNDPQSRRMLDLVVDGFKVDAAWIYLETLGNGYPTSFRYLIGNNDTNYASNHAVEEKTLKTMLKLYKTNSVFS